MGQVFVNCISVTSRDSKHIHIDFLINYDKTTQRPCPRSICTSHEGRIENHLCTYHDCLLFPSLSSSPPFFFSLFHSFFSFTIFFFPFLLSSSCRSRYLKSTSLSPGRYSLFCSPGGKSYASRSASLVWALG